ncbi:MAG: molybdopterin molybdenumtransferase MoeA [Rhodospirillaceae bacterium]|nr:MAG: molybdopterin molybdenumtransferase MoeA [Rhodospirillaceae bacterium]
MSELRDDCFKAGDRRIPMEEALGILNARLNTVTDIETVPLNAAAGRLLAKDVVSPLDVPPHDNAAVDGYAVCFDDLGKTDETSLPVTGHVAAGHPLDRAAKRGEAVRIFTGAPMPEGTDTVFMQEDCTVDADCVRLPAGIARGANRRRRGEDIRKGDGVLAAGHRLRPQDIGLAASIGRTQLDVFTPLRVAVFSTGDEIHEPGTDLPDGGIFDANRYTLMALLNGMGCAVTDLGILPDRLEAIRDALKDAARYHDLLFTSGGVSVGEEDHIRTAVNTMGKIYFWQLAIKPGRPIALGQVGHVPFIGLPGNPVAAIVTFLRFARPAILRLAGAKNTEPLITRVKAGFAMKKKAGRCEWLRCRLTRDAKGALVAKVFPREGSGILSSMVWSDGLVELPEALTNVEEGMDIEFLSYAEVMP